MEYGIYINGWREKKELMEVKNPYDGGVVGKVGVADEEDIKEALEVAKDAFGRWRKVPAYKRSEILYRVSSIIDERKEELAKTITLEGGKPIRYSRIEVARAVETFRFSAEEAKRIGGEYVPMDASPAGEGRKGFYFRVPAGVVVAITPFNFPLNLVAHKLGPSIAAGNTVILKPASATPLTSALLLEIFLKAGLPSDVITLLFGGGERVGMPLVESEIPRVVSFTGSRDVGKKIAKRAGLKRLLLELGSNSGVILDEGIEPEKVVKRLAVGAFAHAGQICISVQRIVVHESIYSEFLEAFVEEAKRLPAGDPMDENTVVGPMISERERDRVIEWVEEAKKMGAKEEIPLKVEGNVIGPVVLTEVPEEARVWKDEVFAPVVSVVPFRKFEEAIKILNNSSYGLNAGIYTPRVDHMLMAVEEVETGGVIINDYSTFRVDHMPYGGVKESGLGREGIKYAIEELTEIRFVSLMP